MVIFLEITEKQCDFYRGSLDRAIATGNLCVRPSVRPSVCHIRDQRLNDSSYRNVFCITRQMSDVSSFEAEFRSPEFRGLDQTSVLKRGTPSDGVKVTHPLSLAKM